MQKHVNKELPLTDAVAKEVLTLSKEIMTDFSRETLKDKLLNDGKFQDWLIESWHLCKDYVYKGIKPN